jgi:alkyl sulfatase BDS1-like metallo-beta-lactamase superfamily hydrolase
VAEVMNKLVFADPGNTAARELAADALEQMGYQAESGPWRNFYLTGAKELREGVKPLTRDKPANADILRALSPGQIFDAMAVRLNADKAAGKRMAINFIFPEREETYAVTLENCALSHRLRAQAPDPDATVTLPRDVLLGVLSGKTTLAKEVEAHRAAVQGNPDALPTLLSLADGVNPWFAIVTP